jgi:hypothetical protein
MKIETKQANLYGKETYCFKVTIFASFNAIFHHVFLLYEGSDRRLQLAANGVCNSFTLRNSLLLIDWKDGGMISLIPSPPVVVVVLLLSALAEQTNLILGHSPMCKGLF